MSEMQTYLPIPKPVTAWQWDGRSETTEKMLKKWGPDISYYPPHVIKYADSDEARVLPHKLMIRRVPDRVTVVKVWDYIIETEDGIYAVAKGAFEGGHQLAAVSVDTYANVSRVEVIENGGRAYVKVGFAGAMVALQDEGQTLKVFARTHKPEAVDFAKIAKGIRLPEVSQAEFDAATNRPLGPEKEE